MSAGWLGVKHSTTELYGTGEMFYVIRNHDSLSGSPIDESGFDSIFSSLKVGKVWCGASFAYIAWYMLKL